MSAHRWELLKKAGYVEVRIGAKQVLDTMLALVHPDFVHKAQTLGLSESEVELMPPEVFVLFVEDALRGRYVRKM